MCKTKRDCSVEVYNEINQQGNKRKKEVLEMFEEKGSRIQGEAEHGKKREQPAVPMCQVVTQHLSSR